MEFKNSISIMVDGLAILYFKLCLKSTINVGKREIMVSAIFGRLEFLPLKQVHTRFGASMMILANSMSADNT